MQNKIYFFPRYTQKGPSSRYRIYNYLDYYKKEGYEPVVYPLFEDWYLDTIWNHKSKFKVLHKIIYAYLKRLLLLLSLPSKSIVYVGAELFPYVMYGPEKLLLIKKIQLILEFDDAVFHRYDLNSSKFKRSLLGNKINKAISKAAVVITGSEYLTNYALKNTSSVVEIPTTIDENKYFKVNKRPDNEIVIGWIGSSTQSENILDVIKPLRRLAEKYSFTLHLVGFDRIYEKYLENIPHRIIKWSSDTEIMEMQKFTIGIMPLKDTPFNRGKCAFKLVQYMGVGIPTISTPLQSNININLDSGNLFANSNEEWYQCFKEIIENKDKYHQVGLKNYEIAMEHYTIQKNAPKYISIFQQLSH